MTLAALAARVPESWRGMSYDLYLTQQTRYWNDQPTYVLDEWAAYTNGTLATNELRGEPSYTDVLQMIEFMGYSLVLASIVKSPPEGDSQLFAFVAFFSRYSLRTLAHVAGTYDTTEAEKHLDLIRTSEDGRATRDWARNAYGSNWANEVL